MRLRLFGRRLVGLVVLLTTSFMVGGGASMPADSLLDSQLGLQAGNLGHGAMEHRWDHQEQIRTAYGYTKFEFDQAEKSGEYSTHELGITPAACDARLDVDFGVPGDDEETAAA